MRRIVSLLFLTVGAGLGVAVGAKLIFGIAIGLPLLPRIPLDAVNVPLMTAGALASFVIAALIGRPRRKPAEGSQRIPAA